MSLHTNTYLFAECSCGCPFCIFPVLYDQHCLMEDIYADAYDLWRNTHGFEHHFEACVEIRTRRWSPPPAIDPSLIDPALLELDRSPPAMSQGAVVPPPTATTRSAPLPRLVPVVPSPIRHPQLSPAQATGERRRRRGRPTTACGWCQMRRSGCRAANGDLRCFKNWEQAVARGESPGPYQGPENVH